jgi:hypothetical protein
MFLKIVGHSTSESSSPWDSAECSSDQIVHKLSILKQYVVFVGPCGCYSADVGTTRQRHTCCEFVGFTPVQLRSLFFLDVVLHHWVIGTLCFRIVYWSRNVGYQSPMDMVAPARWTRHVCFSTSQHFYSVGSTFKAEVTVAIFEMDRKCLVVHLQTLCISLPVDCRFSWWRIWHCLSFGMWHRGDWQRVPVCRNLLLPSVR